MLPPDPEPRMPPVTPAELTPDAQAFLERWTNQAFQNADTNPVLLTFAHHPQLAELFSQFNIHLLRTNTLPVKQRQIAIMRTAWICKAPPTCGRATSTPAGAQGSSRTFSSRSRWVPTTRISRISSG